MKLKQMAMTSGLCGVMLAGGFALAQEMPARNVGGRHPNLEAAQRLVDQAFVRITAAQQANEFDLGGHAAHAKALLDQANAELKAAAMTANHDRH